MRNPIPQFLLQSGELAPKAAADSGSIQEALLLRTCGLARNPREGYALFCKAVHSRGGYCADPQDEELSAWFLRYSPEIVAEAALEFQQNFTHPVRLALYSGRVEWRLAEGGAGRVWSLALTPPPEGLARVLTQTNQQSADAPVEISGEGALNGVLLPPGILQRIQRETVSREVEPGVWLLEETPPERRRIARALEYFYLAELKRPELSEMRSCYGAAELAMESGPVEVDAALARVRLPWPGREDWAVELQRFAGALHKHRLTPLAPLSRREGWLEAEVLAGHPEALRDPDRTASESIANFCLNLQEVTGGRARIGAARGRLQVELCGGTARAFPLVFGEALERARTLALAAGAGQSLCDAELQTTLAERYPLLEREDEAGFQLLERRRLGAERIFVGREAELGRLLELTVAAAAPDAAGLALRIEAPAGAGKTRLLHEARARLERGLESVELLRTDCSHRPQDGPLAAPARLLSRLLAAPDAGARIAPPPRDPESIQQEERRLRSALGALARNPETETPKASDADTDADAAARSEPDGPREELLRRLQAEVELHAPALTALGLGLRRAVWPAALLELDPPARRESLARGLTALAALRPLRLKRSLALALDALEGLNDDPDAIELLARVVGPAGREAREGPGLILALRTGPENDGRAAADVLCAGDPHAFASLSLRALEPEGFARLAEAALGAPPAPGLLTRLQATSGGLPGPLLALCARLRESESLRPVPVSAGETEGEGAARTVEWADSGAGWPTLDAVASFSNAAQATAAFVSTNADDELAELEICLGFDLYKRGALVCERLQRSNSPGLRAAGFYGSACLRLSEARRAPAGKRELVAGLALTELDRAQDEMKQAAPDSGSRAEGPDLRRCIAVLRAHLLARSGRAVDARQALEPADSALPPDALELVDSPTPDALWAARALCEPRGAERFAVRRRLLELRSGKLSAQERFKGLQALFAEMRAARLRRELPAVLLDLARLFHARGDAEKAQGFLEQARRQAARLAGSSDYARDIAALDRALHSGETLSRSGGTEFWIPGEIPDWSR